MAGTPVVQQPQPEQPPSWGGTSNPVIAGLSSEYSQQSPRSQGAFSKIIQKLTPFKLTSGPTLSEFQEELGDFFNPGERSSDDQPLQATTKAPKISVARLPQESGGSLSRSLARCADVQLPQIHGPDWHQQQLLEQQKKRRKSKTKKF